MTTHAEQKIEKGCPRCGRTMLGALAPDLLGEVGFSCTNCAYVEVVPLKSRGVVITLTGSTEVPGATDVTDHLG